MATKTAVHKTVRKKRTPAKTVSKKTEAKKGFRADTRIKGCLISSAARRFWAIFKKFGYVN